MTAQNVQSYDMIVRREQPMKTLKEVEEIVGLKRRAIQEYESAGLATKPIHKNKYGYLLYSEQEIERLWQLRFYKELGYNRTKIEKLEQGKLFDSQKELEKVIVTLKEKREKLDNMINIAQVMQETGLSFNSLRHSMVGLDSVKSDTVLGVLGTALNISFEADFEDIINMEVFTEEELEEIISILEKILDDCKSGKLASDENVQEKFAAVHQMLFKAITESVLFLWIPVSYLSPEGDIAKDIAKEIGIESVIYLRDGLQYYCKAHEDNETDKALLAIFDNIERLGRKKFTTNSMEVQEEVKKVHEFLERANVLTKLGKICLLKQFSELLGSKAYRVAVDKGVERGVAWFCSRAIKIYCDNLSELYG